MELPIHTLLPVRALVVTLQFTEPAEFSLFHQAAVYAFIRHLLKSSQCKSPSTFDRLLTLDAPESGRSQYRAGECYRFTVFALGGGETLLCYLISRLRLLPDGAPVRDPKVPLRNNLRLVSLHDLFSDQPIQDIQDFTRYDGKWLEAETDHWASSPWMRLRWLSPARLLKSKANPTRTKAGETRYCHETADLPSNLLLDRIYDSAADLLQRRGERRTPRISATELPQCASHLFWVESHYHDADSNSKTNSGIMGEILLGAGVRYTRQQLRLMVFGQYLGISQSRATGLGRYRLESVHGNGTLPLTAPANSLF